MKIVNLDKIVVKDQIGIILGGKKHFMRVPTVKDFIDQMKKADEIQKASQQEQTIETAEQVLNLTVETLMRSFPTVKEEQFHGLTMDQLNALRGLAEDASAEDAPEGDDEGEAKGGAE